MILVRAGHRKVDLSVSIHVGGIDGAYRGSGGDEVRRGGGKAGRTIAKKQRERTGAYVRGDEIKSRRAADIMPRNASGKGANGEDGAGCEGSEPIAGQHLERPLPLSQLEPD